MKTVCAWCKTEIEPEQSEPGPDDNSPISHGICLDCIPKFFSFMGKPMRDFLDEFPGPVFLVDKTNRVITANTMALSLIHQAPEGIDHTLAGDLFECPNAMQAGGCGKSTHCKSCTIRSAILDTWQSGQARCRIPAYQDLAAFSKSKKAKFLISTEKVGDAVLLRIDDLI